MLKRKQFTFYRSFYDSVMRQPKKYRLELLSAIIEYALDGTVKKGLKRNQESIFLAVRPNLETARRKAESGMIGGKISKRGPGKKISKGEIETEKEIENEIESESEGQGFLRFWERYPVKLGWQEAFAQWESVCDDENLVLEGLERWLTSEDWKRENGRFIPKPEKWLKEHWWRQNPKQAVIWGASGRLGKAELEAIEAVMRD